MPLTSTFSTISAAQTDANSVLDTILMDAIRQDIDVLYEWMGGPTYTPSTSHDHNGINSKSLAAPLGAWDTSKTYNTVYLAATDLIVHVVGRGNTGTYWGFNGLTDSANPPTVLRAIDYVQISTQWFSINFCVRKGDYWTVNGYTDATFNTLDIKIIPIGV